MKKLTLQEIWPIPVYEVVRSEFRRQVIAHKKIRRVQVGPCMTFVFEDRTTVKFQIQEILRAEQITNSEHIKQEVDGFNSLLPVDGHLSATLLISSSEDVEFRLSSLIGLEGSVSLLIGEEIVLATFEPNRENHKKVSAVQYLDFAIPQKARHLMATSTCKLRVRHPNYTHEIALSKETISSLRQDVYTQS